MNGAGERKTFDLALRFSKENNLKKCIGFGSRTEAIYKRKKKKAAKLVEIPGFEIIAAHFITSVNRETTVWTGLTDVRDIFLDF